jgi:exonuclease III
MKYNTRKRKGKKGGGVTDGIKGSLKIGDTEIKYIKKCNPGKLMCDKDEKNYALCVNSEEDCKDVNYDYEYMPSNPKDPNGLIEVSGRERNPKNVEKFLIEYDEEGNANMSELEGLLSRRLLQDDVELQDLTGRRKSYSPEFHPTSCYIQKKPSISATYRDVGEAATIPQKFSIVTQNALGLYRGKEEDKLDISDPTDRKNKAILDIMDLRTAYFRKFLKESEYPDFLCFQEMTTQFFNFLYTDKRDMTNQYPYVYPTLQDFDQLLLNGSDATVMLISKYPAIKATTYQLQGNSSYYNALGVYEFNNLIIFNCYLQAGSEISPGQKYTWENYSRCRRQQLMFIKKIIDESGSGKAVVVLGDFNSELNALGYEGNPTNLDKWSELKFLEDLHLEDSFRNLHPAEPGLTENTEINSLRFLGKLEEKALRYDGIFYNDILIPIESKVVTNEPLPLDDNTETVLGEFNIRPYDKNRINKEYEEAMVFIPPPNNVAAIRKKEKYIEEHPSLKTSYELFVSDHFGVMSEFQFNTMSAGKRRRKTRRVRSKKRNNYRRVTKRK